jgi:hypothetical protein
MSCQQRDAVLILKKTEAIERWARPTNLQELRRFLGFSSYYRRYIAKFAQIVSPLNKLVAELANQKKGKKVPIKQLWNSSHQEAFDTLKEKFINPPVLGYPDFHENFTVETDASTQGFGAVLSQVQNGKQKIICYASRSLRPSEKKIDEFSSMRLELMALVWALGEKFKDYLLYKPFTVLTDNNPLSYFMTKSKLTAIEQRWAGELSKFDFKIQYRSGKSNVSADALSSQENRVWEKTEDTSDMCANVTKTSKFSTELRDNILIESETAQEPISCRVQQVGEATSLPVMSTDQLAKAQDNDKTIHVIKSWLEQKKTVV